MMSPEVVRALSRDAGALASLFDQYRQFYGQASDVPSAREFLEDRLSREESVLFYVREEGRITGFVQLYPSYSSISLRRLWILNDLFVIPDARRRSVAHRLLEKAMSFASETNALGLTLKTAIENQKAQALYEKMGWRRDERFWSYNFRSETKR